MKTVQQIVEESQAASGFHFHLENGIPIAQNIFRPHSELYYRLFVYAREMKESMTLDSFDRELLESDIGEFGEYEGELVPLDHPLVEVEEEVELESPKRGGRKKYYVFVKSKSGNVIKVEFGDTTGKTAKINDPEARKSFAARHQCDLKTDKTTPGYWSCRLPTYAKQLGLKGGGNFFW